MLSMPAIWLILVAIAICFLALISSVVVYRERSV